jgi:hypothetical protein
MDSLALLFACPTISAQPQYAKRYARMKAMADPEKFDNEMKNEDDPSATLKVKPFYDIIADEGGSHDLYLLKNGLLGHVDAMQRLLEKSTGLHWNLNILSALGEASVMICDYEQVSFILFCCFSEERLRSFFQVRSMSDNLEAAKKITDIRVSRSFFKLFRCGFTNLGKV